jgi:hypothetical protein
MSTAPDEMLIRAAFTAVRDLEPTEAEVAEVLARAGGRRRRRIKLSPTAASRRIALPALAVVALATSGFVAMPRLRAALNDAAGTFADYVAGDDSRAAGRPLRPGESAAHGFRPSSKPRVIAEADGYQLQFVRAKDGMIDFDLGQTGVGIGFEVDELRGHAVYVLGPGALENADEHGHVPLFGVTAPQVATVELRTHRDHRCASMGSRAGSSCSPTRPATPTR